MRYNENRHYEAHKILQFIREVWRIAMSQLLALNGRSSIGGGLQLDIGSRELHLPRYVSYEGIHFARKPDMHLTLLGHGQRLSKKVRDRFGGTAKQAEAFVKDAVNQAVRNVTFRVTLTPEIRYVYKVYEDPAPHTRRTIILMCEVGGAEQFYRNLESRTEIKLALPPFHMTAYTADDEFSTQGIGLFTSEDLERFTGKIEEGDIPSLATAIHEFLDQ